LYPDILPKPKEETILKPTLAFYILLYIFLLNFAKLVVSKLLFCKASNNMKAQTIF